ncbi:MAG: tetratricopeptide repeat protein [Chloroflexota bacterium]
MLNSPTGPSSPEMLEDRIDILFRELELALKWQRPSILFAIYGSDGLRDAAQAALEDRLDSIGQTVFRLDIQDPENADITNVVSSLPDPEQTIIFVDGMRQGAQGPAFNVYRELNSNRDVYVEKQVRILFWLTEAEAIDLAREAPDYWAFRHRAVEFVDLPCPDQVLICELNHAKQGKGECEFSRDDLDAKIALRESLLADLPEGEESTAIYANLVLTLGVLYWKKGEFEKADRLLGSVRRISPDLKDNKFEAECCIADALVKTSLKQFATAAHCYEAARQLAPDQTFPWANLGTLYSQLDRDNEALDAFKKAVENSPGDAVNWNGIGKVYFKLGMADEALLAFQKAVGIAKEYACPWNGLGDVYASLGRNEEAIFAYIKAIELNPGFIQPWIGLGIILSRQKRFNDALKPFQKALQLNPQLPQAWFELGNTFLNSGEYEKAIKAYHKAIQFDDKLAWAHSNLGLAYYNQGMVQDAVSMYQKSLEMTRCEKERAITWARLGDAHQKIDEKDQAMAAYKNAESLGVAADGATTVNYDCCGLFTPPAETGGDELRCEIDFGWYPDTEYAMGKLGDNCAEGVAGPVSTPGIELAPAGSEDLVDELSGPHNASAWNQIANTLLDEGDFDAAIAAYTRAIELADGSNWPYIRNLTRAYYRKGRKQAGSDEEIVEMEAESADSLIGLETGFEFSPDAFADSDLPFGTTPGMGEVTGSNHVLPGGDEIQDTVEPYLPGEQVDTTMASDELVHWLKELEGITPAPTGTTEPDRGLVMEASREYIPADASRPPADDEVNEMVDPDIFIKLQQVNLAAEESLSKPQQSAEFELSQPDLEGRSAYDLNKIGNRHLKAGNYEEAIKAYLKVIELTPEFGWPYSNLGLAYYHLGLYNDAIPLYQKGIELLKSTKKKAITWNRLGDTYRQLNDQSSATTAYQRATEIDPESNSLLKRARLLLLANAAD